MGQQAISPGKFNREQRRWLKREPPVRLVPSRRGVATVFGLTALIGLVLGWLIEHFARRGGL